MGFGLTSHIANALGPLPHVTVTLAIVNVVVRRGGQVVGDS